MAATPRATESNQEEPDPRPRPPVMTTPSTRANPGYVDSPPSQPPNTSTATVISTATINRPDSIFHTLASVVRRSTTSSGGPLCPLVALSRTAPNSSGPSGGSAEMISIGKLTAGGEDDDLQAVAAGVGDDHLDASEPPGVWMAGAAAPASGGLVAPKILSTAPAGHDHLGDRSAAELREPLAADLARSRARELAIDGGTDDGRRATASAALGGRPPAACRAPGSTPRRPTGASRACASAVRTAPCGSTRRRSSDGWPPRAPAGV